MKVLIDTSIWIEFLRKSGDQQVKERVKGIVVSGHAAYTCPIHFELLSAAKDSELVHIENAFRFCHRYRYTPEFWDKAAHLYRELRKRGITVPREDAHIAVAASALEIPLLCRDKHFSVIQQSGLLNLEIEQLA